MGTHHHLNESQQRHLLASCQHADKLLADIEATLAASQSKSPFPKFKPDLSPVQSKVIEDYIARMRGQLVRALDSQSVAIPAPHIGSVHSIRVTLGFVDVAFDECRASRMVGYGDLADGAATEIAGLVDELQSLVARLDAYLAQGESADLNQRIRRLTEKGGDFKLVQTLERVIDQYGLVEFRPALGAILDRLESDTFEIAVFGRVSSGKSSLLNYIVGESVLPVGVTPITSVPTRLAYGAERRATAWFASRKPEQFPIERLPELVTEQHNPANARHVTRIVVELPAPRLRQGVVFVDTPGLGSLATSGAAETRAYLPQCDLGVVLIDGGSTLTQDDLATIQALYDAGIPASVLLSKVDLLTAADRDRALRYVAGHMRSDLGLQLPVHAISVRAEYGEFLERWLASEILPLYDRHAELAQQSLARKIAALRLGVEAALQSRLKRIGPAMDPAKLRDQETELRAAAGAISQVKTNCIEKANALPNCADRLIHLASEATEPGERAMKNLMEEGASDEVAPIATAMRDVADSAGNVLARVAAALELAVRPDRDELRDVVRNMPRLDLSRLELDLGRSAAASLFGRKWAADWRERRIRSQAGKQIADAMGTHARLLDAWVRKTFTELQERFDSYAGAFRAHLDRLAANQSGVEDERTLRADLAALAAPREEKAPPAERPAQRPAERKGAA